MTSAITRTAKSVRGHSLLALLGVLALAAGAAFAATASRKPDFKIVTSPTSRNVAPGALAKFNVTIKRLNGFKGTMSLSTSRLPTGAKAVWKLPDGRTLPHKKLTAAAKKKSNPNISVLPK